MGKGENEKLIFLEMKFQIHLEGQGETVANLDYLFWAMGSMNPWTHQCWAGTKGIRKTL